jgi:cation-transporting ATPase I
LLTTASFLSPTPALLRGLFAPGQRRYRRVWAGNGRVHVEARGLEREDLVAAVRARLEVLDGVDWVWAPGPLGRVVVATEHDRVDTETIVQVIAEAERAVGVHRQPFPVQCPEHPGDLQPLQRQLAALAANLGAAGFTLVGRLAELTPLPVEQVSFVSIVDTVPRLRSLVARLLGWPVTEVSLAMASAVSAALTQGTFGLVVDVVHRGGQFAELRARRQAWAHREAQLCATRGEPHVFQWPGEGRPVPLPLGPIERTSERLILASAGASGLAWAVTSNPRRASQLVLAGLPRAARLGREAFAAQLGRALAARGVVVLDPEVLRHLDRVDTVIVDEGVVRTGRSAVGEVVPLDDVGVEKLQRRAHALFDPDDPHREYGHGRWRLGPIDQLDVAVPHGAKTPMRRLAAGGQRVLGLVRDNALMGLIAVEDEVDPDAELLALQVRRAGHRLLVAGRRQPAPWGGEPDDVVEGGTQLAAAVHRLQRESRVVALVSDRNNAALRAADCGIGITRPGQPVPWDADVLCTDRLDDASFLMQATTAAREVSRRSALLAVGGSGLGGLLVLTPGMRAGHRALVLVNGSALASIAAGAWAGLTLSWQPRRPRTAPTPWHAMPPQRVLRMLESDPEGLSEQEAERRRAGRAQGQAPTPAGLGRAMVEELATPLTPVLAAGAGLSAAAGGIVDATMIATVLGINALVGAVQRRQTDQAIAGLLDTVRTPSRVRRGGQQRQLSSEELVPGDVVWLQSGDVVPADCRLIEPTALEVDESSLTGESLPVRKRAKSTAAKDVADRRSMVYEGTTIAAGEATAVVVATGASTEAGRAADAVQVQSTGGVEQRLTSLTRQTIPLSLIGGAAVATAGVLRRRPIREILGTGVGLTVAAVPEGLPILATVAQLAAARRLSAQGALVRNPRTLETLGRVDALCIDKTGTLTEGRIRLRLVADVADGVEEPVQALTGARRAVLAAALRASPETNGQPVPHPTDRAVLAGAASAAVTISENGQPCQRVADLPFEPARGFHATVCMVGAQRLLSVKGAPEVVLPRCATRRAAGGTVPLSDEDRSHLDDRVERLARRGFRVLLVAERRWDAGTKLREADVVDLQLLGFLALADPVRPTAAHALAEIQRAGIAVAMITGDHPSTAEAVASQLGIVNSGRVLTGAQLDAMEDAELDISLADVTVYARVTPAHKVRIVQALQRRGRTVAMTGDGANDAPAIRLADVGVAIGGAGAIPAARRAADVVITDDHVETLIDAIVEGRAIWASVRDALSILLGGNVGEICYGVTGGLLSHTPVMNARQLLLVNLLTDMAPATVIAMQPPRNTSPEKLLCEGPEASLGLALTRDVWVRAVTTAGGATGAWLVARVTGRGARARTVGLVTLVGTQLGQTVVTARHSPTVLLTGAASFGVLAGVVQTPGVSQFFGCTPLGPVGWMIAGTSASMATATSVITTHIASHLGAAVTDPTEKEEETPMIDTQTQPVEEETREQYEATQESIQKAAEETKKMGSKVGRTTRVVLSETGYATLGLGGFALDLIRQTPSTLRTIGTNSARIAGTKITHGLMALSRRGHMMLGSAMPQDRRPPAAPTGPIEPVAPAEPVEYVAPAEPVEYVAPAEPAELAEPVAPTDSQEVTTPEPVRDYGAYETSGMQEPEPPAEPKDTEGSTTS